MKRQNDKSFKDELNKYLKGLCRTSSALYYAANLTKELGGAKIYLKRRFESYWSS